MGKLLYKLRIKKRDMLHFPKNIQRVDIAGTETVAFCLFHLSKLEVIFYFLFSFKFFWDSFVIKNKFSSGVLILNSLVIKIALIGGRLNSCQIIEIFKHYGRLLLYKIYLTIDDIFESIYCLFSSF